ncbi:GNAT family N-acetyltransferase [Halomonas sp. THAF12]|uniref:GNAT family N-acetyltransferase n=1 Tax=Halomonas sp. B23F22_10 TaxID=3459515 RepID=UPI00373ECB7A
MLDTVQEPQRSIPPRQSGFRSRPEGREFEIRHVSSGLIALDSQGRECGWWQLSADQDGLVLDWAGSCSSGPNIHDTLAAVESVFAGRPELPELLLPPALVDAAELQRIGRVATRRDGLVRIAQDDFFRFARMWHAVADAGGTPTPPGVMPAPGTTVYRRHIPWLSQLLSFRVADPERDLARFHRWMNDPIVARFWEEEGDMAQHRERLESTLQDLNSVPLIACLDDTPFGYFEAYWAKDDRIAPHYDVGDFDRGWHVLIGEAAFRGRPYVAAWMPSISHYLFLDDRRTNRLVIEPRVDNAKMLRNLGKCGYALVKEFDFPHKRAMLGMLQRERFFAERRWVPASPHPGSAPAV